MQVTNEAVRVAQRFDNLFVQAKETQRELQRQRKHRNPDSQHIARLERKATRIGRDARKVSARLKKLMGW